MHHREGAVTIPSLEELSSSATFVVSHGPGRGKSPSYSVWLSGCPHLLYRPVSSGGTGCQSSLRFVLFSWRAFHLASWLASLASALQRFMELVFFRDRPAPSSLIKGETERRIRRGRDLFRAHSKLGEGEGARTHGSWPLAWIPSAGSMGLLPIPATLTLLTSGCRQAASSLGL